MVSGDGDLVVSGISVLKYVINKMTTLETIIKFQFSQFNLSKLNVQNTITCSNNIQLLMNLNVIYKFF